MGYERDHTIVVSSRYGDSIDQAHVCAIKLFGENRVSDILGPFTDGSRSFFVAPDGSKEWWDESNHNDELRNKLKEYMRTHRYDDGSGPLSWAEVQFNDDERETKIIDHSDIELTSN